MFAFPLLVAAVFFIAATILHLHLPLPGNPTFLLPYEPTFLFPAPPSSPSSPLSTSSRWIVDSGGKRVKLACVSWVAHMEPMLPEGLSKQPLDSIAHLVSSSGFNCVRLTWATRMFTDPALGSLRASQSLGALGLEGAVEGLRKWNPGLAELTLVQALHAVVAGLAARNVMVVLDNHVSKPGWCCSNDDGNGFWGDAYFDPDEWVDGLSRVAKFSLRHRNVVGMGLRNEPRGHRQNAADWRKFMTAGAEAVHAKNPNLLVLMSGMSYASDLSFLQSEPLSFTSANLRQKLVYEVHWYAWYSASSYSSGNANTICAADIKRIMSGTGFVLTPNQGYTSPLMVSEFGMLQSGESINDNRFMDCYFALAAKMDLEWALWLLPGSFYFRGGQQDFVETYGIVTPDWDRVSNASFLNKLRVLQHPLPGPSTEATEKAESVTYRALFHAKTGLCLSPGSNLSVQLTPCSSHSSIWTYNSTVIQLRGSSTVITALALGSPASLVEGHLDCKGCHWNLVSDTLQFSAASMGLCLDAIPGSMTVTTQPCLCVSPSDCVDNPLEDPTTQWFQFITL